MYNDIQRMHLTMYCFKPRLKLINLEHNKKSDHISHTDGQGKVSKMDKRSKCLLEN